MPTAPKCWYNEFCTFLISIGFIRNEREPCIFVMRIGTIIIILVTYVDDFMITGNNLKEIQHIEEKLKNKFEIKELGIPRKFLGFEIDWKEEGKSVLLHQSKYLNSILKLFEVSTRKLVNTPMVPFSSQKENDKIQVEEQPYSYKQAIGAILYLWNNTRPDIAFAVNYHARYQSDPKKMHWVLLKRILQYLKDTTHLGLLFTKTYSEINTTESILNAYVDADFAGDKRTRKSTTAYIIHLFGNPVGWCSRLQRCRAESSAEAEYMAICEVAHEILFLARMFEEIIGPISYPLTLFEDSTAACLRSQKSYRF